MVGGAEFDRLLAESRRMLTSLQTAPPTDTGVRGVGEAAGGQVLATASGSRLDSVRLDPKVMRLASQELAEHVVTAVNAALDAVAERAGSADDPAGRADTRALAAEVAELQDQSLRQFSAITQQMTATVARLRQSLI